MIDTEKLRAISAGLTRKFPDGNIPLQIMTRLLEECGELAQQVNHFESSGVKREKYGQPDRAKLAKEAQGVLSCVFQLVEYYGLESALAASLEQSYQNLARAGFIEDAEG